MEEEQNRAGELQICTNSLQEELQKMREEKRNVEVELEKVQSEVVSLRSKLEDAIEENQSNLDTIEQKPQENIDLLVSVAKSEFSAIDTSVKKLAIPGIYKQRIVEIVQQVP